MKKISIILFALVLILASCADGTGNGTSTSGPAATDFIALNDGTADQEVSNLMEALFSPARNGMDSAAMSQGMQDAMASGSATVNGSGSSCTITCNSISENNTNNTFHVNLTYVLDTTAVLTPISFTDCNGYTSNGTVTGTGKLTVTVDMTTSTDTGAIISGTSTVRMECAYVVTGFTGIDSFACDFNMAQNNVTEQITSATGTLTVGTVTYNAIDLQLYMD